MARRGGKRRQGRGGRNGPLSDTISVTVRDCLMSVGPKTFAGLASGATIGRYLKIYQEVKLLSTVTVTYTPVNSNATGAGAVYVGAAPGWADWQSAVIGGAVAFPLGRPMTRSFALPAANRWEIGVSLPQVSAWTSDSSTAGLITVAYRVQFSQLALVGSSPTPPTPPVVADGSQTIVQYNEGGAVDFLMVGDWPESQGRMVTTESYSVVWNGKLGTDHPLPDGLKTELQQYWDITEYTELESGDLCGFNLVPVAGIKATWFDWVKWMVAGVIVFIDWWKIMPADHSPRLPSKFQRTLSRTRPRGGTASSATKVPSPPSVVG